uniref:Uncharacterized protein n=1 Tax=Leersia perrieri TaxID=77586 RepID=A0A0D9V803_9ORYZ
MAAPPEETEAPASTEREEVKDAVEVCLFDESPDAFSRAVRAMSELTAGEPEPDFPDAEVERLASSITFLREWRHFSYEPKSVSFTCDARSAPSTVDMHKINLPQFSSASVPQIIHLDDGKVKTDSCCSSDYVLCAGGNVWALDWCPRLCDRPHSPVNCEYLAVSAHPPGSSYHKIGMPLMGRGIIQVWCLLAPPEEGACNKNNSSNPPKRRGRPRKITTNSDDHPEQSVKKPRGRPRKYPLPIANVEDSSQNDRNQDFGLDPLASSAVVSCDAAVACAIPTIKSVDSTPRKGRGRPRKTPICMGPKRKRGRPRKYPAPSNIKLLPGTDTELGNDTVCLPGSIDCNLGPTENTGSDANLTPVAVNAAFPVPLSSIAIGDRKPGRRGRPRKNPFPSASCLFAPGTEAPKQTSILTNSDNLMVLAKSNGDIVANGTSSSKCNIENDVHLSVVPSDAASPAQGICLAKCKKESSAKRGRGRPRKKANSMECIATACSGKEQKIQTISNRESCPGKGRVQDKKKSASNESRSLALSVEVQKDRSSASVMSSSRLALIENSMPPGSCAREDTANEIDFIGYKSGPVDCDIMNMCEINTSCCTSACNFENTQADQAVCVINELEDTEVTSSKQSTKDDNMSCSAERTVSPVPRDISLPRVVLCLAHNGKVAWDIKWKPSLANHSEQKSCLGFLAVLLGNGSIEVIPLTVDWSPSHDMILAGCHDGTVALWKFSANLSCQGSQPFMCVTAESAPIRAVSWSPSVSEENVNTFVTAGEDGLKFWDLRDPYRPLWELTTAPKAVLSLQWLKNARGIIISLEDGTLKFISLSRIANDVPVTGRPFVGTKTQGVSTYQLSEYLIWSVHASETTGYAAYCVADGTAVCFELTQRFWEKEPGRNRVPYFLCGSLLEEGTTMNVGTTLPNSVLPNVPLGTKRATKICKAVNRLPAIEGKLLTDSEYNCASNLDTRDGQQDEPDEGQGTDAMVLAAPSMQENFGTSTSRGSESTKNFEVFPPKAVALHRLRWNMNKGSERWLCYGGAAGIIRCQRI